MSTEAERQYAEILAARKLLRPSEVNLGHVPGWFRKQLLKTTGCSNGYSAGWAALDNAKRVTGTQDVFDHDGSSTLPNGEKAYVSEPYWITESIIAKAMLFAERTGLDCRFSANSWWYPGQTFRIIFTLKEETK